MEVERRGGGHNSNRQQRELVLSIWRHLGTPKIGADELREIQKSLGKTAAISPMAIARILADEGAELLHPAVIECDARWRETQIAKEAKRLNSVSALVSGKPLRLNKVESLIKKIDKMRGRPEDEADTQASGEVRDLVIDARRAALGRAKDLSLDDDVREEQVEIAEWLRLWLQTPNLFETWLELRKSSTDFKKRFGARD